MTAIEHVNLTTFLVASSSRPRLRHAVVVDAATGEKTCTCEAGTGPTCRHRKAVSGHLLEVAATLDEDDATMADAIAQSLLDAEMSETCSECDCAGRGPLCPNHKEL